MAISVKEAYLFLLDNENQTYLPTEKPVDHEVDGAMHFIEKGIEKSLKNLDSKPAKFKEDSELRQDYLDYRNGETTFLEFADIVAHKRYELKDMYEQHTMSDLFMCEIDREGEEYIVGLEIECKEEMCHIVKQEEGGVRNNLEVQSVIVPKPSAGNSNFFMIGKDKMDITVLEKLTSTVDDDTYLYTDKILECETAVSIKEVINVTKQVTKEIIQAHNLDGLMVAPIVERVLKEMINEGEDIDLKDIAEEVFHDQDEDVIEAFMAQLESEGIEKPVENPNKLKSPLKKTQKIETGQGIKLEIPMDYYNNKEFIDVKTLEDGSISVQLKNISSVENK